MQGSQAQSGGSSGAPSGGAAPAPGGSPSGANRGVQDAGGGAGGAGGDPNVFNIRQAFQKELQGTKGHLDRISKEFQDHKKGSEGDRQILDKIRQAFQPSSANAHDPVSEWESQLDYYLAQGVEAEKAGQGIPLTTNLAIHAFKNAIEQHKAKTALEAKVAKMEKALQAATDPQMTINNTAYGQIDTHLRRTLDSLYGVGEQYMPQKSAQFEALGAQIAQYIENVQKTKPYEWDRLRRDPQSLGSLVEHFVTRNMPPQAVKILEQEKLQNTQMSEGELWQAFREAETIKDPKQRRDVRAQIRQEIFVKMHGRGALGKGA